MPDLSDCLQVCLFVSRIMQILLVGYSKNSEDGFWFNLDLINFSELFGSPSG